MRMRPIGSFIVVPVVIYLLASATNRFHVGIRHLLPIYPFILLIGAAGAMVLVPRRAGRLALGGLMAFWVAVIADVYPHTLTFFNRFVGGLHFTGALLVLQLE